MTYHGKRKLPLQDFLFINLTIKKEKYLIYAAFSLLLCYLFFMEFMKNDTFEKQVISTILIFLFIFLFIILTEVFLLFRSYKKLSKMNQHNEYIINDEGIQTKKGSSENRIFLPWEILTDSINCKKYWLLKIENEKKFILPHNAFDRNKIEEITIFLNERIKK
ncbi:YcxB family protein [Jeotgalibaca ciconiae]|uniref:YcxB family protein n=1 Tax=Jeotgalibaca ciconiae TaxID=2496265 RepID=A0A3Q9BKF3_9LACT|nr:YcxB family protein [Jeotgalibaca ciconiae]AZP04320.1 YcxB family protein [Jeotgalibaca ciconiae]